MDTTLMLNILMIVLAVFTFVCVWLVIPYSLNTYNTEWLPRWIRPLTEIIDTPHPYYYPANESRVALGIALFISFVCTVVAIACDQNGRALDALFYLHAVIPPTYLQHRYYCFHKVNKFSQHSLIERKHTFIVYRKNYIFLIWLYACLLLIVVLLGSPTHTLRWLTLPPFVVALLCTLDEFRNNVHYIGWRCCLSEWMPQNYYLLFALLGIGFTQAALWQHSVLLLIIWITVFILFTVMEFYFRFCSNLAFDVFESWSTDKSRLLLTTSEELRLIRRKAERAMCRRDSSWWLLVTCGEDDTSGYEVELTADLENKQREMMLCRKQLFYLRKFSNLLNAWVERSQIKKSPEKMERLIHDLNPCRKDLNWFDIDSLRNYNKQDVEIEEYEDKTIKK